MDLVDGDVPKTHVLDPLTIKLKKMAHCIAHKKRCPLKLTKDRTCILGSPCVLFSWFFGGISGVDNGQVV